MKLDRRSFPIAVIGGLWALMSAALALPAAVYLLTPPRSAKNEGEWIDAGDISRLPVGIPEEVVFRRTRVDGWKITSEKTTAWVVKKNEKDVVAFAPQCTHLGCAYHYQSRTKEFLCPCHTSTFSIEGAVLTGPAPRPLDRYDIRLKGQRLLIGEIRKQA
jgi:menaquinol-cytochrome c reductase iron-sulfur subunit